MFGKSVQCDVCVTIAMIPENSDHGFDGFPGWIRVQINKPPQYGWARDTDISTLVEAYDCCSISCARKSLNDASDSIPREETVDAANG